MKQTSRTVVGSTPTGKVTSITTQDGAGASTYRVEHGGRTIINTTSQTDRDTVANALTSTAVSAAVSLGREIGKAPVGATTKGMVWMTSWSAGVYTVKQGGREVLRTTSVVDARAVADALKRAG